MAGAERAARSTIRDRRARSQQRLFGLIFHSDFCLLERIIIMSECIKAERMRTDAAAYAPS